MHAFARAPRSFVTLLAAVLGAAGFAMGAAAQAPAELPEPMAPEAGEVVSREQARLASETARAYAEFTYTLEGQQYRGVPYKLGGKVSLEEFSRLLETSPEQAKEAGIDASGLVVQAYRAVIPEIQFFTGPTGQEGLARTVNSVALYRWNVVPIPLEEAVPGDLLFFKSPATPQITGVALVSRRVGQVIRVIVASESRGRVVEVGIRIGGPYWETRVAGLGRLVYAPMPYPAATR